MQPMLLAEEAKAPARMKIHIMSSIFSELAPFENTEILCFTVFPRIVNIATMLEKRKATVMGTL